MGLFVFLRSFSLFIASHKTPLLVHNSLKKNVLLFCLQNVHKVLTTPTLCGGDSW